MYKHCNNCDGKFKSHPNDYKCIYCGSYDTMDIDDERPRTKPKSQKYDEDEN